MRVPAYNLFNFRQLNEYLISHHSETNGKMYIIMKVRNERLDLEVLGI